MKVINKAIFDENLDEDKKCKYLNDNFLQLFQALTGRLRFGRSTDGDQGENIDGKFQAFTTSATPDAENTIAHGLGSIPKGFIVFYQSKAGSLYGNPDGTGVSGAWTSTNALLKCNVASVAFGVFFIP